MRLVLLILIAMMMGGGASLGCGDSCPDRISAVRETRREAETFFSDEAVQRWYDAVKEYCDKCSDNPRCFLDYANSLS